VWVDYISFPIGVKGLGVIRRGNGPCGRLTNFVATTH